jgi:hypothetical protein
MSEKVPGQSSWSIDVLADVEYYSGFTFDRNGRELLDPGERVTVRLDLDEIVIDRSDGSGFTIRAGNIASVQAGGPTEPSPYPRESSSAGEALLHHLTNEEWSTLIIVTRDGAEGRFLVRGMLRDAVAARLRRPL